MKHSLHLTYVIIALIFMQRTTAQTQFAGWAATFQHYKLSDKFGLYFDGQWRSTAQVQQMHALLLRPGVNLYFTPALTGTVGYAFIPQQRISSDVTGYIPEHRSWQQLVYTHPVRAAHLSHAVQVSHRLRLEQRFIPRHHAAGNALVHDGHHYAGRLRYFTRGVIPLSTARTSGPSKTKFTKGFFAALQNEVFFNTANQPAVNGKLFDQNRAYAAAGYRCNSQFDVEMGYMNQYISGTGSNSTNNHILQVATYLRL